VFHFTILHNGNILVHGVLDIVPVSDTKANNEETFNHVNHAIIHSVTTFVFDQAVELNNVILGIQSYHNLLLELA
jgi:hypothetical protein